MTASLAGCLGSDGEYPADTITSIIPYDEGGGADNIFRQMADPLSEELGTDIHIENVPGAGAMRGIGQLLGEEPDGYTIGKFNPFTTSVQAMVNPPDFDMEDLQGLATIGLNAIVLIGDPDEEFDDVADLIDRYNDGEFGNIGGLGASYLPNAAFFEQEYGMGWENYVEYSGGGPINQAVASGEIPAAFNTDGSALPAAESDEVDVLAVLTSNGSEIFPDAPVITELGYENMDFIGQITRSMWVPPGTPEEQLETLTEAVEATVESDTIQEWADETGNTMTYGPPEEADDVLEQIWSDIPDVVDIDDLQDDS
ncbi:Bug family tripartite tricarboxylate transporter substrate binding protein [Natronobacterium texcoconense]|uniref:Bug family tripartite tricarboxylate transporter substrate binding protein n=1 Tax=Natronobacterium texcoconense TaxID=1095778 RepID=UPI001FCD25DF|nr:tripartite tricarboxylate transporter substrate binding protein [Natronobacterium texcoconense]